MACNVPITDGIIIAGDLKGYVDEKADDNMCHRVKDDFVLLIVNTWIIKRLYYLLTFYPLNRKTQTGHILIRRRHILTAENKAIPYDIIPALNGGDLGRKKRLMQPSESPSLLSGLSIKILGFGMSK